MAMRTQKERIAEALAGFLKDFPSLADAQKDLTRLGNKAIQLSAAGKEGHWFSPSRSVFRQPNGRRGNWYNEVLPNLAFGAGWFPTFKEAQKFSSQAREECEKTRRKNMADSQRQMTETQVIAAFRRDFPRIPEDLTKLGSKAIHLSAAGKEGHWSYPARSVFKQPNGRHGNWYNEVLPNLAFGAGWFPTLKDAQKFSSQVREKCKKDKDKNQADSLRQMAKGQGQMAKDQVIAAFRGDFPRIPEGPTKLGSGAIQLSALGKKGHWFYLSRSVFKQPNGKHGNWYNDILPNLAFGAGWFPSLQEAREFSRQVAVECLKERRIHQRKPHTERGGQAVSQGEQHRDYVVVAGTFQRAKTGISFAGIDPLLSLEAISRASGLGGGMPHALVSWHSNAPNQITPGEMVRLKMRTANWGGELAKAYSEAFPYIAPYLSTRLLLLHAFDLVKKGRISALENGASFMSGPGGLYQASQGLRQQIEAQGLRVPSLTDIDAEPDMLALSPNPNKLQATLPNSLLPPASVDFVECSGLYQFHPKRYPTMVKDILAEAHRVLKQSCALLLTSTGKQFGQKFEEALKSLGLDIITPANTRLELTPEVQERIREEMGVQALNKTLHATHETFYLVAVKSGREPQNAAAGDFSFERPKYPLPEEAKALVSQGRQFNRDVQTDDSAAKNIELFERTAQSLSPEQHQRHAVLIQTILDKYFLAPVPYKPKEGETAENAARLVDSAAHLETAKGGRTEAYFMCLSRIARLHASRLSDARAQPAKQKL